MKLHVYILLLAGVFPYQASGLVSEALETAGDITSDAAHAVAEPVGEVTDVGLDASIGTVERLLPPYGPEYVEEPVVVEQTEEESDDYAD